MKTEQEIEKQKQYIEKVKEMNQGKNLKYYILTMGCQLNENDSEKLCGMVEKMGYMPTDDYKEADLVMFNTCCVRENALRSRDKKEISQRKPFSQTLHPFAECCGGVQKAC